VPNVTVRAPITYYALDLEERELVRTLGEISTSDTGMLLKGKVETKGMLGTYDDGLKFVQEGGLYTGVSYSKHSSATLSSLRALSPSPMSTSSSVSSMTDADTSPPSTPDVVHPPLHILFLGSSIGNFNRKTSADFLRSLPLRPGSEDTLLLGLDHDNSKQVIEEAYNDPAGHTKVFIMNGLKAAGRALGDENMFDEDKWEYVNKYNVVCHLILAETMLQLISLCQQEKRTSSHLSA
jgi:L-histidine Nalpha-methyltransferase / hercynylcysteine S-oxide synthase